MKKSILDRLPKKQPRQPVQADIPVDLYNQVVTVMKKRKITWVELVTLAVQDLIEEDKGRKSS